MTIDPGVVLCMRCGEPASTRCQTCAADLPVDLEAAYRAVEAHLRQRCGEHIDVHIRRGRVVVDGREIGQASTLLAAVNALGR